MQKLGVGIAVCVGLAVLATALGRVAPIVGAPVFAIVLGLLVRVAHRPPDAWRPGIAFSGKKLLQAGIVILGATLDLGHVARVGADSLVVTLGTLVLCLVAAVVIGRALRIDGMLQTLIGVGTAICGASAIAAVAPVVSASAAEIAYSVSTIFFFNVVAVFVFPALGHLMQLGQHQFGLWAGTAINDTSSVVAAGYAYGQLAGDDAVVVKLARATLIVPIVVVLAVRNAMAKRTAGEAVAWRSTVPWFILWFVVAAALHTAGIVPQVLAPALSALGAFCIAAALAGIGLSTDFEKIRSAGFRPLALGGALWIVVAGSSLVLQRLTGR